MKNKPTPQNKLYFQDIKTSHTIGLHKDGKQVGLLDFGKDPITFEGNASESAKVFVNEMRNFYSDILEEKRQEGIRYAIEEVEKRLNQKMHMGTAEWEYLKTKLLKGSRRMSKDVRKKKLPYKIVFQWRYLIPKVKAFMHITR